MGLFDRFKGDKSNVKTAGDRIWLTKQAKLQGISSDIAQALADQDGPIAVLLVTHFSDYFEELRELVRQGEFDEGSVLVAMAEDLTGYSTALADLGESRWIQIVVTERHPLSSHDESLVAFARAIPGRCRVVFHLSLDDPLMQVFAGEWVKGVLRQLGMLEHQAIESRMVARRITEAQRKIEGRATHDSCLFATESICRSPPIRPTSGRALP